MESLWQHRFLDSFVNKALQEELDLQVVIIWRRCSDIQVKVIPSHRYKNREYLPCTFERWWDWLSSAGRTLVDQMHRGSQWRECSNGTVWENAGRLKESHAATFWIYCRDRMALRDRLGRRKSPLSKWQGTERVPEWHVDEMDESF